MGILAYIIINLLLFSSWHTLLFNKKDFISFPDRMIGASVLSLTQIIATELLLGLVFRKLHALPLFSLNIFISSTVLIFSLVKVRILKPSSAFIHINLIFEELREKISRFAGIVKSDRILVIIFCLFSLSLCWMIFTGYLFPSYTWDALWYHLPIVGYILQNGAIQEIANNSFIEQFINIFPKNIELLFLWNIIFLKSDILTDFTQMLFALMGVLTVCSLAIKLKVSEKNAIYSGFLFFFTPIMILQSTTNYVDIAISVLFLVALNFLVGDGVIPSRDIEMRINNDRQRKLFLLFGGLSAGILLGSKGSGPLFIVILSALVIMQKIRKHFVYTRNKGISKEYKMLQSVKSYIIFFALPTILMGGYWYMKNWVLYNNPVYPMEISLFGKIFFKGLYKEMIEPVPDIITRLSFVSRPVYVWLENVEYYLYDSRLSGITCMTPGSVDWVLSGLFFLFRALLFHYYMLSKTGNIISLLWRVLFWQVFSSTHETGRRDM